MEDFPSMGGGEAANGNFALPHADSQGMLHAGMDENEITKLFDQI
jgi:hypothetical protein